ncbi:Uncharacterised protein [uncultured archaeon]|nr:Uncharacterised protein [uncultured archaeon]
MNIHYYIDPETDQPHIYTHHVSEAEVEDVISKPGEDRSGKDGSRVALGQSRAGRYLKVIYVIDLEPKSIFVITAFDLTGKPLVAYKRRSRKKHEKK